MKSFREYVNEQAMLENVKSHLDDFIQFACDYLEIDPPPIELVPVKEDARQNSSFGGYMPALGRIRVNVAERHRVDVYRTLAHELVHHRQNLDGRLDENSGDTGSDIENEANAVAGIIMRNYAKRNSNIFESVAGPSIGNLSRKNWGSHRGVTVEHPSGGATYPLHHWHLEKIANLEHGEETPLHLETKDRIIASRDEDDIHLHNPRSGMSGHLIVPRSKLVKHLD